MMPTRLLSLFFALACLACADSTVTVCGLDQQAGAGVNFAAAMAKGGLITFNCGASPVINISKTYTISALTTIQGPATLQMYGTVLPPAVTFPQTMFTFGAAPFELSFFLNQISLKTNFVTPYIVQSAHGIVNLDHCRVETAINGFFVGVGTVNATATDFVSNIGTAMNARFVSFSQSTFTKNVAGNTVTSIDSTGGTIQIAGSTFTGGGRVACTSGALTVRGTKFLNLSAPDGQSGGALILAGCKADISTSSFTGNKAAGGGAIAATQTGAPSTITISSTQFSGNSATSTGGAILLPTSLGVAHTLTLRFTEFSGNTAQSGGAIDLGGKVNGVEHLLLIPGSTLNASTVNFHDNTATGSGGAILGIDAQVGVTRGLFTSDTAGDSGGAVYLLQTAGNVVFANTLFIRNTAKSGSAFSGNSAQFLYSTIAANNGIAISSLAGQQALRFSSSIVSNNGANCDAAIPAGAILDAGKNLQYPGPSCGSFTVADPALDSMFIPGINSPAQASGDNAVCARPEINSMDLLGQHRPRVSICTAGAIEGEIESLVRSLPDPGHRIPNGPPDFSITASPTLQEIKPGGTATYTITALPANGFGAAIAFSLSGSPAGSTFAFTRVHGMTWSLTVTTPAGSTSPSTTDTGGTSILSISGASGSISHTVFVNLTVSNF